MFGTQLLYEAIYDFPMAVSMQLESVGTAQSIYLLSAGAFSDIINSIKVFPYDS